MALKGVYSVCGVTKRRGCRVKCQRVAVRFTGVEEEKVIWISALRPGMESDVVSETRRASKRVRGRLNFLGLLSLIAASLLLARQNANF